MDDVLTELRLATESIDRGNHAQRIHNAATDRQLSELWEAIAEGRDELLAVANRLENLTKAVTTDAAEVAARIVTDANRGIRDADL